MCMLLLHKHKIINNLNIKYLNYNGTTVGVFFVEQQAWFVVRRQVQLIRKFRLMAT